MQVAAARAAFARRQAERCSWCRWCISPEWRRQLLRPATLVGGAEKIQRAEIQRRS
ncbi:hypothetical protein M8494_13375 [Serratia ureilytica]